MKWTETSEDEVLMQAYQLGDSAAFAVLYRRYSGRVFGYIRQKVGNSSMADDLFQSVFLKLHQFRHRYNATFPFQPWIFTICRNAVMDHWRQIRRVPESANSDTIEKVPAPEVGLPNPWPDLSSLTNDQRQAIELRYKQEMSFDEISKILETSPTNVRQMISRAIRGLKNVLQHTRSNHD